MQNHKERIFENVIFLYYKNSDARKMSAVESNNSELVDMWQEIFVTTLTYPTEILEKNILLQSEICTADLRNKNTNSVEKWTNLTFRHSKTMKTVNTVTDYETSFFGV
jgi:hypothetical protein